MIKRVAKAEFRTPQHEYRRGNIQNVPVVPLHERRNKHIMKTPKRVMKPSSNRNTPSHGKFYFFLRLLKQQGRNRFVLSAIRGELCEREREREKEKEKKR